jgi:hypothetical protein
MCEIPPIFKPPFSEIQKWSQVIGANDAPQLLVVAELLDTMLIGEGLFATMRDLKSKIGTEHNVNVASVPSCGGLMIQFVESELLSSWHQLQLTTKADGGSANFRYPHHVPWQHGSCSGTPFAEHFDVSELMALNLVKPVTGWLDLFHYDFLSVPGFPPPPPPNYHYCHYHHLHYRRHHYHHCHCSLSRSAPKTLDLKN